MGQVTVGIYRYVKSRELRRVSDREDDSGGGPLVGGTSGRAAGPRRSWRLKVGIGARPTRLKRRLAICQFLKEGPEVGDSLGRGHWGPKPRQKGWGGEHGIR